MEDAWGWRDRVVETVACGTMLISVIFLEGGRGVRVRYFGGIVNVFSFFLISRVVDSMVLYYNFSFVDLVFRGCIMV